MVASWSRSILKFGLNPANMKTHDLMRSEDLTHQRNRHGALLNVARPILDNVFRAVGQTIRCC